MNCAIKAVGADSGILREILTLLAFFLMSCASTSNIFVAFLKSYFRPPIVLLSCFTRPRFYCVIERENKLPKWFNIKQVKLPGV